MFFPLASCMFFLPVISFVLWCLPLAVPVCPQRSMSLPSICWDFVFTWLIPSRYIPAQLSSPCASVSGNPASRGGESLLVPSQGRSTGVTAPSPLPCCILRCLDEGRALGKTVLEASDSLLPFLCAWLLQQSWEISCFLHQRRAALPARGVNQEPCRPCCGTPLAVLCARKGSAVMEQPVAAGRSGCGGGRSRVRAVQRWAGKWDGWLEARWMISEQEAGGRGFSAVCFHLSCP